MLLLLIILVLAVALFVVARQSRRHRRAARGSADRLLETQTRSDQRDAELRHLVHTQLPALEKGLWQGQATEVPGPLHQGLAGTQFGIAQAAVLQQFHDVTVQASNRAEGVAKAMVLTVMQSMQSLLNDTTHSIENMLERHHDPMVLADANDIDHASSQLGRRVQVINVLLDAWPGRQRKAAPLLSVVRGGQSRIRDYDRIKITGDSTYSVVSGAVEPVVLAVAELLDNAARHSEPGADVQVWFVHAHNGVTIMIDDSGVGLKPEARQSAATVLSGQVPVRLTQMGSRPKFGFLAVGVLARRYGFQVSVDQTSPYGGVRAAVYVPAALLTVSDKQDSDQGSAPSRRRAAAAQGQIQAQGQTREQPQPYAQPQAYGQAPSYGRPQAYGRPQPGDYTQAQVPAQAHVPPPLDTRTPGTHGRHSTGRHSMQEEPTGVAQTAPPAAPSAAPPADGALPQRRRRAPRATGTAAAPGAQAPISSSNSLGDFVGGIHEARRARRNPDERT
ncbi:ATP-binding protein [Streptomyces sp. 150FB]|uniref:ATP-binding protein n=1 Tax=Streptomyces sp. 150FB TaxID=1576605 RepID=UPI000696A3D8|nr:ATP-binding protein [Streptomyces sp. 150FB]